MQTTVIVESMLSAGSYRNLEKLLNSWFIEQAPFSQELHLDSVAVDLTVISLWPSVESRLKMLDIITVRVSTTSTVNVCSHSDKESYKNLGQSESRWLNWSCSCSKHYHSLLTHRDKHSNYTWAQNWVTSQISSIRLCSVWLELGPLWVPTQNEYATISFSLFNRTEISLYFSLEHKDVSVRHLVFNITLSTEYTSSIRCLLNSKFTFLYLRFTTLLLDAIRVQDREQLDIKFSGPVM